MKKRQRTSTHVGAESLAAHELKGAREDEHFAGERSLGLTVPQSLQVRADEAIR